jgi:hypothetical protein
MVTNEENWIDTNKNSESNNNPVSSETVVIHTPYIAPIAQAVEVIEAETIETIEAEELPPMSVKLLQEIMQSDDLTRLHPYMRSGELVVIPHDNFARLMKSFDENMIILQGLSQLYHAVEPAVKDSKEGRYIINFFVENASIVKNGNVDMIKAGMALTHLPKLFKYFKTILDKVSIDEAKKVEMKPFLDILKSHNHPLSHAINRFSIENFITPEMEQKLLAASKNE